MKFKKSHIIRTPQHVKGNGVKTFSEKSQNIVISEGQLRKINRKNK